jgi:Septum formation
MLAILPTPGSPSMSARRLLPPAIAVVVVAIVGSVLWLANRSTPIPTTIPKTAPAVRSCWNVDAARIGTQLPWLGSPVVCTAAHTAEIVSVGQVDQRLVRTAQKATGQDATVNSFVMATGARAACLDKVGSYVGGAWRGAQLTVYPDFVAPAKDGFFACVIAQVADPGGQRLVTRTASLAGALSGPGAPSLRIDCVRDASSGVSDGPSSASVPPSSSPSAGLSFVECGQPHTSEFVGLYTVTPANAPYNGTEIQKAITTGCQQLVDSFVGVTAGQTRSDLHVSEVGPDSANLWAGSDQTFACYASAATPWSGSLKGIGTRALQR